MVKHVTWTPVHILFIVRVLPMLLMTYSFHNHNLELPQRRSGQSHARYCPRVGSKEPKSRRVPRVLSSVCLAGMPHGDGSARHRYTETLRSRGSEIVRRPLSTQRLRFDLEALKTFFV